MAVGVGGVAAEPAASASSRSDQRRGPDRGARGRRARARPAPARRSRSARTRSGGRGRPSPGCGRRSRGDRATSAPCSPRPRSIDRVELAHLGPGARAARGRAARSRVSTRSQRAREERERRRGSRARRRPGPSRAPRTSLTPMYRQPSVVAGVRMRGCARSKAGICSLDDVVDRARRRPRSRCTAARAPRATHSAHDCSATPHCSSPPPLVIESPNASTPSRQSVSSGSRGSRRASVADWSIMPAPVDRSERDHRAMNGREDIERAAADLAERLPERARAARAARLQLPLVVAAGRPGAVPRRSTPSASSCACQNPVRLLQEAPVAALRARPPTTTRCSSARRRARGRDRAPTSSAAAAATAPVDAEPARSRSCAPSTASTSRCRSTPAASARSPATCSRRPPTAPCRWSPSG